MMMTEESQHSVALEIHHHHDRHPHGLDDEDDDSHNVHEEWRRSHQRRNNRGSGSSIYSRESSMLATTFSDHANANNGFVVRATEGWLELFLTTPEKYKFSQWTEHRKNSSISYKITRTTFDYISKHYIPDTVAPNLVALVGLLSLAQGWYLTNLYGILYPTSCTWLAVVCIVFFFITTNLHESHATRTRQRTALGDLFKYSCDAAAVIFLSVLTTYCVLTDTVSEKHGLSPNGGSGSGGNEDDTGTSIVQSSTSIEIQWYCVQISQLVLYLKHLSAFHRHAGLRYYALLGPGEVLLTCIWLLVIRATVGLDWLLQIYDTIIHHLPSKVLFTATAAAATRDATASIDAKDAVRYTYYTIYLLSVIRTLNLKQPHGWSRFGLSLSLLMRIIPAFFFVFVAQPFTQVISVTDVICDGLFMAVLTSDVMLSKMAGREVHPWVVTMSLAAGLSHSTILTLCLVYYIAVFADLCSYMNMPLLTTCRNVYCDGVYDLCHIGHKRLFQNALQYGNRLFVGVVGDEDAQNYKRPPIMSHKERCDEVMACKAVTKVIPNSPCFGLTKEFLDNHQIHVVAYGEEYLERYPNPKDDPYYRVPREMGIARPLPRTQGLSTSDLIRRIQAAAPADKKKSPT